MTDLRLCSHLHTQTRRRIYEVTTWSDSFDDLLIATLFPPPHLSQAVWPEALCTRRRFQVVESMEAIMEPNLPSVWTHPQKSNICGPSPFDRNGSALQRAKTQLPQCGKRQAAGHLLKRLIVGETVMWSIWNCRLINTWKNEIKSFEHSLNIFDSGSTGGHRGQNDSGWMSISRHGAPAFVSEYLRTCFFISHPSAKPVYIVRQ